MTGGHPWAISKAMRPRQDAGNPPPPKSHSNRAQPEAKHCFASRARASPGRAKREPKQASAGASGLPGRAALGHQRSSQAAAGCLQFAPNEATINNQQQKTPIPHSRSPPTPSFQHDLCLGAMEVRRRSSSRGARIHHERVSRHITGLIA